MAISAVERTPACNLPCHSMVLQAPLSRPSTTQVKSWLPSSLLLTENEKGTHLRQLALQHAPVLKRLVAQVQLLLNPLPVGP